MRKTGFLNSKAAFLNSEPALLNSGSAFLNSKAALLNSKAALLNSGPAFLNSGPALLYSKPAFLNSGSASLKHLAAKFKHFGAGLMHFTPRFKAPATPFKPGLALTKNLAAWSLCRAGGADRPAGGKFGSTRGPGGNSVGDMQPFVRRCGGGRFFRVGLLNPCWRLLPALLVVWFAVRTAAATDFATEVMDATFKFYDPDSTGTCFLVRRTPPDTNCYLVTAAHVMEETKGPSAVLVLRSPKPDGSYERHDYPITLRSGDKPRWVRHKTEDVAVLRLPAPLPVAVAALPESVLADDSRFQRSGVHICSPLFVLTYPARLEANDAGFPIARSGIFASPPLVPMPDSVTLLMNSTNPPRPVTFLADFTTFSGDSGGPVFIKAAGGRPLIVGIVLGRGFQDVKRDDEYGESIVHYPLGLGIVLHAQCVRDTLDAAAKPEAHATK